MRLWAQAVKQAGTVEPKSVAAALRANPFDTVLGTIVFDEKADVTGYEPFVWDVWREGKHRPATPAELTESGKRRSREVVASELEAWPEVCDDSALELGDL